MAVDPAIFMTASAIFAGFVGLAFLITYRLERRFAEYLAYSALFVLIALFQLSIGHRAISVGPVYQAIPWLILFGACASLVKGLTMVHGHKLPRHWFFGGLSVQLAFIAGLWALDAPVKQWEIYGRLPSVALICIGALLVWREGDRQAKDKLLVSVLIFAASALFLGGVWIGGTFSDLSAMSSAVFVSSALAMVIFAIIAMALLAYALFAQSTFSAMDRIHEKSTTDRLSGLLSRAEFEDRAKELIDLAHQESAPVSVMVVDIDRFKRINDSCGHQAGDQVISSVGALLNTVRAPEVLIGRIGGEEFGLVLSGYDASEAYVLAERLREDVAELDFAFLRGRRVTASFGVACLVKSERLIGGLGRADRALYASKSNGRNRVTVDRGEQPPDKGSDSKAARHAA